MSIAKDFQKAIKTAAKQQHLAVEKGFIHWYVRVAFGNVKYEVTDGSKDGGIDAIVWITRPKGSFLIYLLQSKYTGSFFTSKKTPPLVIGAYESLDRLPPVFETDALFDNWLGTVDPSLRAIYKQVRTQILAPQNHVEWRLFTLHGRSRAGENRLVNLPVDSFIYGASLLELYEMELEGATPPGDPLELNFVESMTVEEPKLGYKSYVLAANVRDFLDYLDGDPDGRLFARNVRLDLKSKINASIRETFEDSPEEFWYSHNGITVICSSASIKGKRIRMVNPSVINGSQTLHSLREAKKRNPNALVLTRVMEVGSLSDVQDGAMAKKKFVNDVIFRTNQQNKMYIYNLRANDVRQVEVAKEFIKERVFYERRRGEWRQRSRVLKNQGLDRTNIVEIAQIGAAFDPKIGVAEAKKSKEDLFRKKHYDKIFYQSFDVILLEYRLFGLVEDTLANLKHKGSKPRQRKHALLTSAAIVWDTVAQSKSFGELKKNRQVMSKLAHGSAATAELEAVIGLVFVDLWNAWAAANAKDPTISPNNFFKNEKTNAKYRATLGTRYSNRGGKAVGQFLQQAL